MGLVIDLKPKGRPCKMCKSVRRKLGHTNYKLSSWWKHSTEAAKSEWSKRFVSRHVVFGSL